jgi:hypothetical protein
MMIVESRWCIGAASMSMCTTSGVSSKENFAREEGVPQREFLNESSQIMPNFTFVSCSKSLGAKIRFITEKIQSDKNMTTSNIAFQKNTWRSQVHILKKQCFYFRWYRWVMTALNIEIWSATTSSESPERTQVEKQKAPAGQSW